MPSFNEDMSGEFSEQYLEAVKKEISALIHQNAWITVPRSEVDNVFISTQAFKLERLPDRNPSKFKARFCVKVDLQRRNSLF